jgi:hypothetical protein
MNFVHGEYSGIDIIGDVHGEVHKLRRLLEELEYRGKNGTYVHASRFAIFLGDFINRGPEIRKTINLIRTMAMAGQAYVIIGNHEYNAVAYAKGLFIRANPSKHAKIEAQLAKTLAEYRFRMTEWGTVIEWLMGLPICLEMHGIRCVHACWRDASAQAVINSPLGNHIAFTDLTETASIRTRALKVLMNGIKITAPASLTARRTPLSFRIKWWQEGRLLTWRDAGYPEESSLPNKPLPEELQPHFLPYPAAAPPTFFGHYGFAKPAVPLLPNLACLDFGVSKGGKLGAYRWMDGEKTLSKKSFVLV